MNHRNPHYWNGLYTPLMKLGTLVFNKVFPEECPPELLFAAADYCRTRIIIFLQRKNNHKNRCSIKYYTWWLEKIEWQLGCHGQN